ncbi:MAG: DNA polymerase III subunit alpha [Chlamydiia bacterium]
MWISLTNHSGYSILSSTATVEDLVAFASEQKMGALALTDTCNLFGAIDFYKECRKKGVKPLIGMEAMLASTNRFDKKRGATVYATPCYFIAKNRQGYQNLCALSSLGYIEGFYYTPRIDKELIEKYHEGLICITGSHSSYLADLALKEDITEFNQELDWWVSLFKEDFYLQVERHKMDSKELIALGFDKEQWLLQLHNEMADKQEALIKKFQQVHKERGISVVATNNVQFIQKKDYKAQEILMNIQSGDTTEILEKDATGIVRRRYPNPKRRVLPSAEVFFKTSSEMELLFADMPEAIVATKVLADSVDTNIDFDTKYYPVFVPPELEGKEYKDADRARKAEEFLSKLCEEGISRRYTEQRLEEIARVYPGQDPLEVVRERLAYELEIITSKGMCDYLLIVYDFIYWAKSQRIPMGPGRGSGVGSIICYLTGITDIEPLRFHLLFERFINPDRLSYPDIDVDICMDRRQEVIDYTIQKYGKDRVAQIITFGTMKAKMAVKDVGRVLSVPLAKVNLIAKLIPDDLQITLTKALEVEPELKELAARDPEVAKVLEMAQSLEGSIRNTGIHAAGMIISAKPLVQTIPVCTAKDADMLVTQYAMKPVEAVGMLKIDFLGLKTLTSIQKACDSIEAIHQVKIDWVNLPLNDKATFDLLNQGKTSGIFQLESQGMQDLARQLHIDKFEEIIAVGALYRPGPMEMIPSFIQRKHGREKIEFDHPWMEQILQETYGIMVYQEQVMQIASKLAGYTLGEGDVLRRAMGKKDAQEMGRQRDKFRKGALENGISQTQSMAIFDKVEKFASYGFNKSHAAAYGFLSYVAAFLKANYPAHWMAALMTCDMTDISKVAKHSAECKTMAIPVLAPSINDSEQYFTPTQEGIRFALGGIKGIGEGVVQTIIETRKAQGQFKNLADFVQKADVKKIGKKTIETLIEAGCFDQFSPSRRALLGQIGDLFDASVRIQKEKTKGYISFFAEEEVKEEKAEEEDLPLDRLFKERELLGFYLTGHPLQMYAETIEKMGAVSIEAVLNLDHSDTVIVPVVIEDVEARLSQKTQKKFAILKASDLSGTMELLAWSDLMDSKGSLIKENALLVALIEVEKKPNEQRIMLKDLFLFDQVDPEQLLQLREKHRVQQKAILQKRAQQESRGNAMKAKEDKLEPTLKLSLNEAAVGHQSIIQLKKIFNSFPGRSPVLIEVGASSLKLDANLGVKISSELVEALRQLRYVQQVVPLE